MPNCCKHRRNGPKPWMLPNERKVCWRATATKSSVTVALDDWVRLSSMSPNRRREPDESFRKRLLTVAQAVDPDEWRNQVRGAALQRDAKPLIKLAASPKIPELPLQTLSLLGWALDC